MITPPSTGPLQITGSVSFASIRFTDTISIPQVVVAGRISPSALPTRFIESPKAFGIDGPVISPSNIAEIAECGANIFVCGSAVFEGDIQKNVKEILEQMNK